MHTRPTPGGMFHRMAALTAGLMVAMLTTSVRGQDANALPAPVRPEMAVPDANAPTTQPSDGNDVAVLTSMDRIHDPNANISTEAIELTDVERTVLGATRDGDRYLFHNAMYVLLDKARSLKPYSPEELTALESPSYAKMRRHPKQYRGQPIRLDVYVMTRHKLVAGKNLPIKPGVTEGDTVWQLNCFIVGKNMGVSRAMPLTVFSVVDPNDFLGTPIESDTGQTQGHYRKARIAGLFYKVYKGTDREGKARLYPAVVAWQFVDRGTVEPGWSPYQVFAAAVAGLIGLALLFRMVKRYRNYARQSGRDRAKYVPLREEQDQDQDDEEDQELVDGPVDPDLASAAEEHIRKVRTEDTDDQDDPR
ncbi:MAG: hypothetical protein ACOCZU_03790 [Planctomycetota bacterium]